ncbi:MAG: hypothetical protein EXR21_01220 [Flavobacteriaceae bacterium]|nr:hypothetical protein [Flavobacteriaceae bacterium]
MKCNQCHAGSNFAAPDGNMMMFFGKPGLIDPGFNGGGGGYGGPVVRGTANIGLDKQTTDPGNNGAFKIPSLRNIALTGPYMHDGRFAKLDDVLEHYSHGIKAHPGLDSKFKDGSGRPRSLNLSAIEKDALIAFLSTLTDQNLITNLKFADPFKP